MTMILREMIVARGNGFSTKDYIAEMAKVATRARDIPLYPKMLIYARKKQGKTTFGLSAGVENTLVIDPEIGAAYKRVSNPHIVPINKWEDMQMVYGALRSGKVSPKALGIGKSEEPYTWILIDGLTRINNFALKFVMKVSEEKDLDRQPGFVQQRDYGKSGELMKNMLTQMHALKLGVIYTAQEKLKPINGGFDDDDADAEEADYMLIPEIPDAVRGSVNSLVDVIGRLYVVRTEVKGELRAIRRLRVGVHEKFDTGFRSEYKLPDIIKNPSIPKLVQLMEEGVQ